MIELHSPYTEILEVKKKQRLYVCNPPSLSCYIFLHTQDGKKEMIAVYLFLPCLESN